LRSPKFQVPSDLGPLRALSKGITRHVIERQNQPWTLAPTPELAWSEGSLRSVRFDDIYFSTEDGIAESRYVFLEGCELPRRVAALTERQRLCVAETGFGTGLNFLLTLEHWLQHRPEAAHLHYIGIEAFPLRLVDLKRANAAHPQLRALAEALIAQWPSPVRGCHRLHWPEWSVTLDLWFEEAGEALDDLASRRQRWVDCWYLDGFAPARDPDMWREALFQSLAQLSKPGAQFATFTAAGNVRRGLQNVGFSIEKRPGFGRKRECLAGRWQNLAAVDRAPHRSRLTPWDLPALQSTPESALVVGGGLAGAHMARSLAERGIRVQVLEQGDIAQGGSSNLQGLTYTRLSRRHSPLVDFGVASYGFSTRLYRRLLAEGRLSDGAGAVCGFVQRSEDTETLTYLDTVLEQDTLAQIVTPEQAQQLLGIVSENLPAQSLFFPEAQWLNPAAVCRERLDHPLIEVITQCKVISWARQDPAETAPVHWRVKDSTDGTWHAELLVVCTAIDIQQNPELEWLPLQGIRGQTSHLPQTPTTKRQKAAFCHEGYFPPPRQGVHCIGASYGPNDTELDERLEDHQHNLALLDAALPGLGLPEAQAVTGHVALRCTSADYLPLIGAAPDRALFNACYAELGQQKTRFIDVPCPVLPGLWVLGALGSRGLTAAPLAAEIIASEIMGEPPPVSRYLSKAVAPSRFLQRAIVRGNPL